jgi:hypothetical protein
MKNKKSDSDWAALFAESIVTREKRPPGPGWKTAPELASDLDTSIHIVKRRVSDLVKTNKAETFVGTCVRDGRLGNQTWYRIKKGTK